MKFIANVCAAFLAWVSPVSTMAKPSLHEHDDEARDQHPHHVDGDLVVADGCKEFLRCGSLRVLHGDVGSLACTSAGWIGNRSGGLRGSVLPVRVLPVQPALQARLVVPAVVLQALLWPVPAPENTSYPGE